MYLKEYLYIYSVLCEAKYLRANDLSFYCDNLWNQHASSCGLLIQRVCTNSQHLQNEYWRIIYEIAQHVHSLITQCTHNCTGSLILAVLKDVIPLAYETHWSRITEGCLFFTSLKKLFRHVINSTQNFNRVTCNTHIFYHCICSL